MVVLAIALYLFFKPSLTAIDTVVKIAAVIVGGAWTYLNYVRGRTYSRRLELAVSGAVTERDDVYFLTGSAGLKTSGYRRFRLGISRRTFWCRRYVWPRRRMDGFIRIQKT